MSVTLVIYWSLQILLIPTLSPLLVGVTRRLKAVLQNRTGAPVWQSYRDLWKLFHKNEVISEDASWIFLIAPYLVFAVTLIVGASIPLITTALSNHLTGDFLVVVYLLAFGTFFLALAGLDAGSAFGGFGSSREMMVAALAEGGLILSLLTLALLSRTTNLIAISENIHALPMASFTPIVLAFISFSIALLAENSRYPFDNPSTHLELTMIHEAMILEYSGKRLGLMEWTSANKFLIFISLGANLFFPWGIASSLDPQPLMLAFAALAVKAMIFCAFVAVLESSIAKLRILRLPELMYTSMIISAIAVGLVV